MIRSYYFPASRSSNQVPKPLPELHRAAEAGNEEAVNDVLQKRKANVNERNHYGGTALTVAAHGGHSRVVQLLLEKGRIYT